MLGKLSLNPQVKWKLTIIERNLSIHNWINLTLEAQDGVLDEVLEIMNLLPSLEFQHLFAFLKDIFDIADESLNSKIKHILMCNFCRVQLPSTSRLLQPQRTALANETDCSFRQRNPIRLFIRQPFTESDEVQKEMIQGVLNLIDEANGKPYSLNVLTGLVAQSANTFRQSFEDETGINFNYCNFRSQRLRLLREADAMVIIRTNLSGNRSRGGTSCA